MPLRVLPARAARLQGSTPGSAPPTRRPGSRVTRSSVAARVASTAAAAVFDDVDSDSSALDFFGVSKRRAPSPKNVDSRRSKRRRPNTGYYNETSDDEDAERVDSHSYDEFLLPGIETAADDGADGADDSDDVPLVVTPTRNSTRSSRVSKLMKKTVTPIKTAGLGKSMTKRSPRKLNKNLKDLKIDTDVVVAANREPAVTPPWHTLPYFILLRIFRLAAGDQVNLDKSKWLLSTSLVCRAFTEPALTALYRQPPLLTPLMAHRFVELLAKSPDETVFNYRQKVRVLSIDVFMVAARKFNRELLDWKKLISNIPQLEEIDLHHYADNPAAHELTTNLRWRYPTELLEALGYHKGDGEHVVLSSQPYRLSTWTWSSRMMGDITLEDVVHIHHLPAFRHLRKITLINFQVPSLDAANPDDPAVLKKDTEVKTIMAKALSVLPDLTHLVIESSTAVTGTFLQLLPKTLRHVEFTNCWDLTSEDFTEYLLTHGSQLRHIELFHNQTLSLEFLPMLGDACPLLEALEVDLTYYSLRATAKDTQPVYDVLFTAEQIPKWPASLAYLKIVPLRQIDEGAAEMFFQSLVTQAANLPLLRHLEIKTLLNIPIRERCHLRDKWGAKLREVFLRPSIDPAPVHSLRTTPIEEKELVTQIRTPGKKRKLYDEASPSPRRSTRIATGPSGSPSRAGSVGRETQPGSRPFYAEPDTDEDIFSDDEEADEPEPLSPLARELSQFGERGPEATFIQGKCEVVDIQIDNQKPVELQWTADDFLDSEPEDLTDDEWNGQDPDEDQD